MSSALVLIALVPCVLGGLVNPQENEVFTGRSDGVMESAFKLMSDCRKTDFGTCFGVKAVSLLNRMARMDNVNIFDGVSFVRTGEVDRSGRALSESELENSLPEEPSQKSSRLVDLFLDAALRFFKSHTLQLRLPESTSADLQRAFEEGRKLKKSLLPIMIGVAAKVFAIIPIILGGLALVATKALILGKIAFVIAAVMGMQKLFSGGSAFGSGFGKGGSPAGWSSSNSYNTGGWSNSGGPYYRSFNEAESSHNLAYSAQAPKS
ncbi:UNVERIFIED_CONTAM: hypothetical protein PYX00_004759 [Menopon gallinae]|uniref:Uncharacterized protein n=1 Tax=Menopon gallinae TaxID=328185 RepID=A0AAW2I747_9NEOP